MIAKAFQQLDCVVGAMIAITSETVDQRIDYCMTMKMFESSSSGRRGYRKVQCPH
jgi:hypothetical protein